MFLQDTLVGTIYLLSNISLSPFIKEWFLFGKKMIFEYLKSTLKKSVLSSDVLNLLKIKKYYTKNKIL